MRKFLLYLNTIKYLKVGQIFFRLIKPFKFLKNYPNSKEIFIFPSKNWKKTEIYEKNFIENNKATFLNTTVDFSESLNWSPDNVSKLWLYNLHYLNDLVSFNSHDRYKLNIRIINHWTDNNVFGKGIGWEPYPLSIRQINILKFFLNGNELNKKIFNLLHLQASYLFDNLEKDILANHYFTNLKAMLFSGVILKNNLWVRFAIKEIYKQIDEQVHEDGFNFELSPMYHDLMLVDVLDIYNLIQSYYPNKENKLKNKLKTIAKKMLHASHAFAHHDNGLPFFNDSVDGISPKKKTIFCYAKSLGMDINSEKVSGHKVHDYYDCGFFIMQNNHIKIFFDACEVGAKYQPGHAHADSLSLEVSINGARAFVNSGISEYGDSPLREYQRSTRSHSTVEINEKNSSEVWSSFRVGKRANIIKRAILNNSNKCSEVIGAHNGYSSFLKRCTHQRIIKLENKHLRIEDHIIGTYKIAFSRIYLHPDVSVKVEENKLLISHNSFRMISEIDPGKIKIIDSYYYPEFGTKTRNKCIEFEVESYLKLDFKVSIR